MRPKASDEQLRHAARTMLDQATEKLDEVTALRLRRARLAALDHARPSRRPWFAIPRWVTAGGLTTAAVMVVAVSFWSGSREDMPVRQPEEVAILTAQEQLELYEDLEFYRWLATDDSRGKDMER